MIRFRLKGYRLLQRLDLAPLKERFLRRYFHHLHRLLTEYLGRRIAEGRLGKSRWRRYAYYRGWVLARYGSDRARKAGGPKRPRYGVDQVRFQLLARRLERTLRNRRLRQELEEVLAQARRIRQLGERERYLRRRLEEEASPLARWLAQSPAGRRVLARTEQELDRLYRLMQIDLSRGKASPENWQARLRHWIRRGVPTTVSRGWKYAHQTGGLAQAWQGAKMEADLQKGEVRIIPREALDRIQTRKGARSLSLILSRTLKASGQSGLFLSPQAFGRLSREAMERAAQELGVSLR